MQRNLLFGALVCAAAGFGGTAEAKMTTLGNAGFWTVSGGTTDSGKGLCTMYSSGNGLWFGVKYFKGDEKLTVQVSQTKWTVKDDTKIKVKMKIDAESPWSANATGFHMSDGDAALEFSIPSKEITTFIKEFSSGETLFLGFPESKVDDWTISLKGSTAIAQKLADCIKDM